MTLKIYSPSKFQIYNTVLLVVITMLYIISPEFTHIITESLHIWCTSFHFSYLPVPASNHSMICSMNFSSSNSTLKCDHRLLVLLCLTYFIYHNIQSYYLKWLFFIHYSSSVYLGCFHILTVMNNAKMNMRL
jgi:hypothetical protein